MIRLLLCPERSLKLFLLALLSWGTIVVLVHLVSPSLVKAEVTAPALASLQSYTGIINLPNARVLPDWHFRFGYGNSYPYRYYGTALGLWNRFEFHGQFTEITTIEAFPGEGYGYYKDRSAGARIVLLPEGDYWPQVATGFYDATGTALFGTRYLVASKVWGNVDFTLGLGQGILAGEYVPETTLGNSDQGFAFLLSSLNRPTKPFAALEWHVLPRLTFSAETSGMDRDNLLGYRKHGGVGGKLLEAIDDSSRIQVDMGLKYRVNDILSAQMTLVGGVNLAGGLSVDFPLGPEGILPWKKNNVPKEGEGERWAAHNADKEALAAMIAQRIKDEGFQQAAASCSGSSVWIEVVNNLHLSPARAIGHIFLVADGLLPEKIETVYLNIREKGQVVESLRATRADIRAYVGSYQDTTGFLNFADLDLYGNAHWQEYVADDQQGPLVRAKDDSLSFALTPKIRTFLNNRSGFFKHKGLLRGSAEYALLANTTISSQLEVPLFNQFDELDFNAYEPDAVRTDVVRYEEKSASRLTSLVLNHFAEMPYQVQGRLSVGYFESAYAGFGGECFRFFHDGLWGVGLEAAAVRKRSLEDNFTLSDQSDHWFRTGFVNFYTQLWPDQGLEGGLKFGRFLAGDPGVRIDLRRSFRYFTIGAWYTKTDTSLFQSAENRNSDQKGVYIRIPLSLFTDHDRKGHIEYDFTSFTRDSGAMVQQPKGLYPMDPWSTPTYLRRSLGEMRRM